MGASPRCSCLPRPRARPQPDRGRTGGRFHPNFDRIGGLKDDLPQGWIDRDQAVDEEADAASATRSKTLCQGNEIFQSRTRGIGVIPADIGQGYGLSGANMRASGVDWDDPPRQPDRPRLRQGSTGRSGPTPTATRARAAGSVCRKSREHARSSISCSTTSRRPGHGQGASHHQGARGRGLRRDREPARRDGLLRRRRRATSARIRVKIRSASFNNISITPWLLKGVYVPDIVTILASLYFILGDIDR